MKVRVSIVAWCMLVAVSFYSSLTFGAVIRVPSEQPSIQAGINAAQDGDTVLVADGVYTGSGWGRIGFYGKGLKVISENGPDNCIIDGMHEAYSNCFSVTQSVAHESVVGGYTIKNFRAGSRSGSAFTILSSATISDCILENPLFSAVFIEKGISPTIRNCRFLNNRRAIEMDNRGRGADIRDARPLIVNCLFADNEYAFDLWGYAYPRIRNCTITQSYYGIYVRENCRPQIINSIIYNSKFDDIYFGCGSFETTPRSLQAASSS